MLSLPSFTKTIRNHCDRMTMNSQAEVEKRDHGDSPASLPNKRRKVSYVGANVTETNDPKVDPSELASAFALASLASLSPNSSTSTGSGASRVDTKRNDTKRRAGFTAHGGGAVHKVESWEEARSPKAEEPPSSPDQRSPGSPKKGDDYISSPEDEAVATNRRVHFAQGTKEHNTVPSTPVVRPSAPMPPTTRALIMPHRTPPPPTPAVRQGPLVPRPRQFYGVNSYGRPPPPPQHHMHQQHSPFPHPQTWYHSNRVYPPTRRLMQPPLLHPENQWICDYCNVAAFATYEEACIHEETCKIRYGVRPDIRHAPESAATGGAPVAPPVPMMHMPTRRVSGNSTTSLTHRESHPPSLMSRSSSGEDDSMSIADAHSVNEQQWCSGSLSLAMEESDREWLSELNCFVRKHCVEAFSATEEDVARSSKRGRIAINQVGIRCCYCSNLSLREKAVAAVSFPTSIGGIYESVKRWQRVHLEVCDAVPEDVRNKLASLANTNVWVPTTRQYWTDSAKALGLVDTNEGIRFSRNPSTKPPAENRSAKRKVAKTLSSDSNDQMVPQQCVEIKEANEEPRTSTAPPSATASAPDDMGDYIVYPGDMELIPHYVYFLMRQVEPCRFTEADRFVARSKGPVGYPGFQCRHCNGHAGLGKYFPVSAKSLSTNSTSQNIHAHLLKCRKCPDHTKDRLVQLKIEKSRSPRLEPGWRKVFFDKVWGRLHG